MTLEDRVIALESSARRWRRCAVAMVLCAIVGGTVAATQEKKIPKVLRARSIEVLSEDGSREIYMYGGAGGSGGRFQVGSGKEHCIIVGRGFWAIDSTPDSNMKASRKFAKLEASKLHVVGSEYRTYVGENGLWVSSVKTTQRARPDFIKKYPKDRISTNEDYAAMRESLSLVALGLSKAGHGLLQVRDNAARECVQIGCDKEGGRLIVTNQSGTRVCTLSADDQGNGQIRILDRNGKGCTLTAK